MKKGILIVVVLVMVMCGTFLSASAGEVFDKICTVAKTEEGIKMMSYDQFVELRNSGEEYYLLDVLSSESYLQGHIQGARSFPVGDINKQTAENRLSKKDDIVVYCGSFMCSASTNAAKKLQNLGYKVVDYKGGLQEWKEKGNTLVRGINSEQ